MFDLTPERYDFIRAIREHPLDHAYRLAYADWLRERGGPDEELANCIQGSLGITFYYPKTAWFRDQFDIPTYYPSPEHWRLGLVWGVRFYLRDFLKLAPQISCLYPVQEWTILDSIGVGLRETPYPPGYQEVEFSAPARDQLHEYRDFFTGQRETGLEIDEATRLISNHCKQWAERRADQMMGVA